jgi:hypothetical protein
LSSAELERWNQRFAAAEYVFGTAPNAFLAARAALLGPGQRALCVADGEGRNSVWLAEQRLEVTAFDFSPVALDKARRLAAARGVQVRYELASVGRPMINSRLSPGAGRPICGFDSSTSKARMMSRIRAAALPASCRAR